MIKNLLVLLCCFLCGTCCCQVTLKGKVRDAANGEPVFSANVIVKGSTTGVTTDFDGEFTLQVQSLPVTLVASFIGYNPKEVNVSSADSRIEIKLGTSEILIDEAEIVGERISEKQKQNPLTVESMDAIAIKEAPSGSFYEGLGNLKGVDLTSASLGFKVINTRGFNSTSPVRSLQLIDGVDNQSPGLNFSLGNFLGAPDLDVKTVDIVAGASSAFFGPGAFNGVINMETKNPFLFPGMAVQMRVGERSLFEHSFRYAEFIENKEGHPVFAYKLNFYSLSAADWEADNDDPV
ncbi:MAG: carboxypeptidase-like regulatory domain-containing protein, partial [Flavobacteriales bacterium]